MPWMIRWPGGFPVFAAEAHGARFRDVDGHEYVDFCLGDTAAMTGHSPAPTVRAVAEQVAKGITGTGRTRTTRSGAATTRATTVTVARSASLPRWPASGDSAVQAPSAWP
jgi:glutamate-1-semialdehyde aminotransferase